MQLYQRVRLILAEEGLAGLCRRARRKFRGYHSADDADLVAVSAAARHEYTQLTSSFARRAHELGCAEEVRHYYWYHTVDLGNGLITPGDYDYRSCLPHYQFPADMTGLDVLDVGSATGYFAFEFEKRGARVLTVELPSLYDWDMPACQCERIVSDMCVRHHAATPEQAHERVLDGPFQFCHRRLESTVRRHYSTVYDLTRHRLGTDGFDLVFLGDVFCHLMSPLRALDVLATLCRDRLVLTLDLADTTYRHPMLAYVAAPDGRGDNRTWWAPNYACIEQMLRSVGFCRVQVAGQFDGVLRRCWMRYRRYVIHATKYNSTESV